MAHKSVYDATKLVPVYDPAETCILIVEANSGKQRGVSERHMFSVKYDNLQLSGSRKTPKAAFDFLNEKLQTESGKVSLSRTQLALQAETSSWHIKNNTLDPQRTIAKLRGLL